MYHGCSADAARSIAEHGFVRSSQRDDGYFGRGIYATPNAEYACLYASILAARFCLEKQALCPAGDGTISMSPRLGAVGRESGERDSAALQAVVMCRACVPSAYFVHPRGLRTVEWCCWSFQAVRPSATKRRSPLCTGIASHQLRGLRAFNGRVLRAVRLTGCCAVPHCHLDGRSSRGYILVR